MHVEAFPFIIILGCSREIGAKWALRHHFVTTHVQPLLPLIKHHPGDFVLTHTQEVPGGRQC